MQVSLHELTQDDLPLLLAWAWIPQIWEYLPTSRKSEKLTWENHFGWWKRRKNRIDWLIIVDQKHPHPVGVVHVSNLNKDYPEIGLYIGEVGLWGRGVGAQALEEGVHRIYMVHKWGRKPYRGLHAIVHPENITSVKLFTKVGFAKTGKARKGQDRYEYTFDRPSSPIPEH